jgi:hypothetical protein
MKTWLAVGLTVLLGIGAGIGTAMFRMAQHSWDSTLAESEGSGEAKGEPTGPQPRVSVNEESYNFGMMDSNSTARHEFVFTNIGEAPLKLEKGATSCKCTASVLEEGEIAPGESATVVVEWKAKGATTDFTQTAIIKTNDLHRPRVTLTIQGRVTVAVRAEPTNLIFTGVKGGEPATAVSRVYSFMAKPLEITGHKFLDPATAEYFEVACEPLSVEDVAKEEGAKGGLLVRVTVKPGLPVGAFRQTITLQTNSAAAPEIALAVEGTINSEISVVGSGWNPKLGILDCGVVESGAGATRNLFIRASGPHPDEVSIKVAEVHPDLLKVEIGKANPAEGGNIALIPLTIKIPKGSHPASYLELERDKLGRIILETNQPQARHLQILVRFAVEG